MASAVHGLILTLSFLPAAAQDTRPFSHKFHLTVVVGCEGCHTEATESKQASDNLLPTRNECARCHDEIHIKQVRPLNVQKFNHAIHVKLGNTAPVLKSAIEKGAYLAPPGDRKAHLSTENACAACHIGIEQSENINSKPEGKAHYPHMADCLVCHNKIDPPQSCGKCHTNEVQLKPGTHTPAWVNAHSEKGAKIDKTSCAVCHGRNFRCQGCH